MISQLERDIQRRMGEKLLKWIEDSKQLCEMAEIPEDKVSSMVIYTLLQCLVGAMTAYGLSPGQVMRMILRMHQQSKEEVNG